MTKCASCGTEVSGSSRFCSSCGGAVQADSFATQTVAATSPMPAPSTPGPRTSPGRGPASRTSSQGRFAPGELLGGRYRIIAMLGKGGMGEVYRADDLILEQPVALKFLPEALSHNEDALARFRNEVRTARQVSHPNVCRMYDLGEAGGHFFLSMEYVDGEDLGSLLRRIGRLPADKAQEIARKLCAGLAAAHEKGVLHRDLKPNNVMLDSRGQVLLTDFGLAGIAGQIPGSDVRSGTPAYMAPEQLSGEEVTFKSDIYSLGLVLYEIFTGKLPFESTTLAGLVKAQQESTPVSPSSLVRELDPMVERVILRCLQPKPASRPASALAIAAALPGGDPLAAALAAGETPSPEMVAAAGEGEGLALAVAVPLFLGVLAALVATGVLATRSSTLERLRPEYSTEVLAQKARDMIRQLGFANIPAADQDFGIDWDSGLLNYFKKKTSSSGWDAVFAGKPPLLRFWYRQAQSPLTAIAFHDDLLTPGLVAMDDPPPTDSGMISLVLDSQGRLLWFERMPPQLQAPEKTRPTMDWNALFTAAGLDQSTFQPSDPQWVSLAASDTRMAWTATEPRPLRVEAAALRGRLVYFQRVEPFTKPDRMPQQTSNAQEEIVVTVLSIVVVVICGVAALVARRNLSQGRGDRRGAFRLGAFVFWLQMALWIARSHLTPSIGTFAMFILAVCTAVFYGAVMWTVYIALEPYARRRWPQTLISWSSVLIGRLRDPIVGRDVLIGAALGASLPLINQLVNLALRRMPDWSPNLDSTVALLGARSTLAAGLMTIQHGIRETLFFFFLIFLFRIVLRNQWLAGAAFALLFALLSLAGANHPVINGVGNFLVVGGFAFVMLRWGLLAMAVGICIGGLVGSAPVVAHTSDWYFGYGVFLLACVVALTAWGFRTAIGGQKLWKGELLG